MTPKKKPAKINELGWYEDATIQPVGKGGSPIDPKFLVIHYTEGAAAQSSIDYWKEINNGILAHFIIDRDGTIYQCRSALEKAGHAGKSRLEHHGETFVGLNAHSIGIELANGGCKYPTKFSDLPAVQAHHENGGPLRAWEDYPDEQLDACADLCNALVNHYPIKAIKGHSDISPKRRLDPGPAFPMDWLEHQCDL
jgi:N-acetylmuramoyl-L-alanine amidase